jgi:hypothetical protein
VGVVNSAVFFKFGQTSWPQTVEKLTLSSESQAHQELILLIRGPPSATNLVLHKPMSACTGISQLQVAGGYLVVVGFGSLKVNRGVVSIADAVFVLVVCQFGHIGVPHIVVALTTCPAVWNWQLQDHGLCCVIKGTEKCRSCSEIVCRAACADDASFSI